MGPRQSTRLNATISGVAPPPRVSTAVARSMVPSPRLEPCHPRLTAPRPRPKPCHFKLNANSTRCQTEPKPCTYVHHTSNSLLPPSCPLSWPSLPPPSSPLS
ncbi:hypothetical protein ACFX1S_008385 [Malus domestica]